VAAYREAQKVNKTGGAIADPAVRARWIAGMARAVEQERAEAERATASG
jgi:hypothetical protein